MFTSNLNSFKAKSLIDAVIMCCNYFFFTFPLPLYDCCLEKAQIHY